MSRFGDLHLMLMEPRLITESREVLISNSELKALRAVPQELVPAQGAGKLVEFVSAVVILIAGANVLAETTDNLVVRYTNGGGVIVSQPLECTGFIDHPLNVVSEMLPKVDPIADATAALNAPLVLHNSGDGEFTGNAANDATLSVVISYRVHVIDV